MNVILFSWLCFIYPANLYIFERFFAKSLIPPSKVKVVSIVASCFHALVLLRPDFSFQFSRNLALWSAVSLAPFILPLLLNEKSEFLAWSDFLFWRNFVVAPACEELYYRILLPQLCPYNVILSVAFSLAHAHPLVFTPLNIQNFDEIIGQCVISFAFGLVSNALRAKMTSSAEGVVNVWIWTALTALHGVANYCGFPLLFDSSNKAFKILQIAIIVVCVLKILL